MIVLMCGVQVCTPVFACQVLSGEAGLLQQGRLAAEARKAVVALKNDADQVFIGRLNKLAAHQGSRALPAGTEQRVETYQVMFDSIENVKGNYVDSQVLIFSTVKNLIELHCLHTFQTPSFPKENGIGYRYIVYAKAGIVVRAHQIPSQHQPISAYEEAEILHAGVE